MHDRMSNDRPNQLAELAAPPTSRAEWAALLVAMAFPTALTWVYFVALAEAPTGLQQAAYGLGKTVRILVFAEGEDARIAEEAGADYVGGQELAQKIQDGWMDFDMVLATPPMMRVVGRLGRILGPRGLMPNPRAGTIAQGDDLAQLINESRLGRVEFRVDKTSNLHAPVGKVSFEADKLLENTLAFVAAVRKARPAAVKGAYIRKMVVSSCMGPGIKVDLAETQAMAAV